MKRALMLGLLTLIAGLLGTIPATASGSVGTPTSAPAGSNGSSATNLPQTTAGTGFTYQGSLNDGMSPADGQYDFTFTLFDALTAGNQVGTTVTILNKAVANGLFTLTLDFGVAAFQGDARWLQIDVRASGGGSYTTLAPRQALTGAPYAMSLVPGAVINAATGPGGIALNVNNSTGNALAGFSGSATDSAISGVNSNTTSALGVGVKGVGNAAPGVEGDSTGGYGGFFSGENGVKGQTSANEGTGVVGQANNGYDAAGVFGTSTDGYGIYGTSTDGYGIYGTSENVSIYGESASGDGIDGLSTSGNGIYGQSENGYAGFFDGNVHISGTCCAMGTASAQIDDPLDPANKYLNQSLVASPDMLDILSDNVTTDAGGNASVQLPPYFEALNTDFRYQLTVVGQFSQAIISSKVKDNSFTIKTDKPNVEVSWQVTGVRHDPYAVAHPIQPEQAKPANEQGMYLHPRELGQPASLGLDYGKYGKNQTAQSPQRPQLPQLQPSSR